MAYPGDVQLHARAGYAECATQLQRETAATTVLGRLESVADRARCLADRSEGALAGVTRPVAPETDNKLGRAEEYMPPLFDSLRGQTYQIEQALRRIEDVLDRLEL